MTTGIAVRDLRCLYDGATRPALDGVSLDVPRGRLTLVMGATGAGKSTLGRCLTRIVPCFLRATVGGEVLLEGVSIADRRVGELAGVIGMVFQDFEAQLFSTDVTQEVIFGLEHTGLPPSEMPARVQEALAAVGLTGFEGRDPTTLSGGEKQRLAVAGLLAMRPGIMVLDEPTTDLDPVGRAEILAVLAAMRGERLALLLVEHDVGAAVHADRLVLLRAGRVIAEGPPATILADVARCEEAGVRPHDVCRVFAALGLSAPPLDVEAAAACLRDSGVALRPAADDAVGRAHAPLLVVEGLAHRWPDGREALRDVGFTLGAGEFVAIVGRNGSGKTTLAKHLNGLLHATAGRVRLDGRDVGHLPLEELAQRVGYVFQDPDHQLFAATVFDEVAFGPRNVGLAADAVRARVDEALAAVGLEARDDDPFLLDKGARQRLAVAAVLALRPQILVLDEPTTGLDWPEQHRMLELLASLHAAGQTIVVITHTPWVVAEYAARVLMLSHGRLHYDGPVRPFLADAERHALAAFRPPDVTSLGRAFGCTPRSVDELLGWVVR